MITLVVHAAGGGSGIGRACCILFAREGATVVVTDIAGHEATLNMLDGEPPTTHKCARHRHRPFGVRV
jgi:NAD(P)-dependent dehydrogenase (short-subunit alcohol dehydrogenase family)